MLQNYHNAALTITRYILHENTIFYFDLKRITAATHANMMDWYRVNPRILTEYTLHNNI